MSIFLPKKGTGSFLSRIPTPITRWALFIGLFVLKNEKILELIKLTKLMKASSAVASTFSILASIGFHAIEKGSAFALAFIGALLMHEAGHVWAIHRLGLGGFWETFFSLRAIPGVGAFIQAPPMASREEEAFIGYGGPLFSVIGGAILLAVWFITPHVQLVGLHHAFLTFAIVFLFVTLYYLSLLRSQPIGRSTFAEVSSWNDVFHQFFAIPLVRKICAHAFLGSVALLIWIATSPVTLPARDFIFLAAFISIVIGMFNLLITIRPLDGGRILQIVGSLFAYVGVVILIILTIYIARSSVMLVWMIVLVSLRIRPLLRFYLVAVAGIGLVLFLVLEPTQTYFESIIDILLGFWMLSIAYTRKGETWQKGGDRRILLDVSNSTEERRKEEVCDRRKEGVRWRIRLKWFVLYLLLLIVGVAVTVMMVRIAPTHFK